jgi:CRP-like cAMP-binding protein
LFSTLTRDELKEVLSGGMEVRALAAGEVVVAEGSPGDSMFALVEGTASVYRGWGTPAQRKVAQVATGDIFGEAAMVSGGPRLATVVTDGEAIALEFRRDAMLQIVRRHGRVGQMVDQFYRERLLANVLRASPVLRMLPEADKKAFSLSFQPCNFADGAPIIVEGQAADSVHLLLRGICSVTHQSGERYQDLREGDLFGEVSVLTNGPATASVAAVGPVLTLRLPAEAFKMRVLANPAAALAVKRTMKDRLEQKAKMDEATAADIEIEIEEDFRV